MERPYLHSRLMYASLIRNASCLFISWFVLGAIPLHVHAWELAREGTGIQVYTRKVSGSKFKEYKGIMTVEASLSSLIALVNDVAAYPKWIDTCKEGKTLKRISPTESYAYTVNKAFPVANRDAIVRNVIQQDPETLVVTIDIEGKPDFIPENKNLVRVTHIKGFWRFTPLDQGKVEIVYQVHNEPGGGIPAWLVNSFVVKQPFRTLVNMQKMINESRYPIKQYGFIKEVDR